MTFKTTPPPPPQIKNKKEKEKENIIQSIDSILPSASVLWGNGRVSKWSLSLGNSYADDIHSKAVCMLAGFRLETRWRTEDHSGTVYRRTMNMYTCTCT